MMKLLLLLYCSLVSVTVAFSPLLLQSRKQRQSSALSDAKIGVFFGTSTGSTEEVADMIVEAFGSDIATGPIEIDSIQGSVAQEFAKYDAIVCGTPTWNTGADTERSGTGWDEIYYGEMQDLDIAGKKVGVFGLGDSVSYAENYADASGELHDVFEKLGCKMMGYTSQEGYEHEDSKAIRGDLFCGLLCDQVNQEELTEERVQKWVEQLKSEGILLQGGAGAGAVVEPAAAVVEVEAVLDETVADETERNNDKLKEQLEDNSRLLDETISAHGKGDNDGYYIPHISPRTGKTMWISTDGRTCYYTVSPPSSKLSP